MGAPETSISMIVHFSVFKKLMLNYFNENLTEYWFCVSLECHLLLLTLHKMVSPCCKIIKEILNMSYQYGRTSQQQQRKNDWFHTVPKSFFVN